MNEKETVATLHEPTDDEIGNSEVVATVFLKCRIELLKAQNEECGCNGLVERCDLCDKRAYAINELAMCL